jgi:hypothetical protein
MEKINNTTNSLQNSEEKTEKEVKTLKKTLKESEEKGFNAVYKVYKKVNDSIDKTLSEILDEKPEQKFGLIDIYKWIKKKFIKFQKDIEIKDEDLLEENKKKTQKTENRGEKEKC